MKFAIGAMSVGDVLDRSLKILLARFPQFFLVNFVCQAPFIVVAALLPVFLNSAAQGGGNDQATMAVVALVGGLIIIFVYLVMIQVATAATLRIVLDEYAGRQTSIGEAFRFAFSKFVPLFGTSLIAGLVIMGGMLLCFFPGLYAWIAFLFISQVVVLENLSGPAALKRSNYLVTGHRWRAFGTVLLFGIINSIVQAALAAVLYFVWPSFELRQIESGGRVRTELYQDVNVQAIQQIVTSPIPIILGTYMAIGITLLYLDMRIRKEAFDLELAAAEGEAAAP